jgi:predicted signal transduction protein with EAL and GGDEF domain
MRSITTHRLLRVIGSVIALAAIALILAGAMALDGPQPDWPTVGLAVAGTVAGYHLQVVYRIGSQRLLLVWCQAASAVALVLTSGPWMVLTTAAGWSAATFGPGGLPTALKAAYNTSLNIVAAAAAAIVYHGIHAGPTRMSTWPDLAALAVAMVVYSSVVELGVPAVISAASGRSFGATFRENAATRFLQATTDLTLAVAAAIAAVRAPKLLLAIPVIVLILHLGYRSAAAARTERQFGQRLIAAIREMGNGPRDREAVAARAVQQVVTLLGADTAELVLHGAQPRLQRHTSSGDSWSGQVSAAESAAGRVAEVLAVGDNGGASGELRVFFSDPVRLGERERSALQALASALDAELRNAAAHDELAAAAAAAAHAAAHDATTGLPGRQLLLDWVSAHVTASRAAGTDEPMALACINIKGFAEILAELPAETADRLLAYAAGRLRAATTEPERLAHVGGDTFALWMPTSPDVEHARERAADLLTILSAQPSPGPTPVVLSGVAGLVWAQPSTVLDAEQLLRQARAALRLGHRTHDTVAVYRADNDIGGQSAIVLTSELRSALRGGQLELAYEPVLELATGQPLAVECMPQWLHPNLGLLPGSQWVPIIEQSELRSRYVPWILDEALAAHRAWCEQETAVPVVVRLPSPALLDPSLPALVAGALAHAGTAPEQLTVHLADSSVLTAADIVDRVLVDLVSSGVRLAIGTAGTSLEQLCRVPANEIKLSGRTTALVRYDQEARAKVRALVAFADELELQVTAQDIPTLEHVEALVRLRVHAGQGACLFPPLNDQEVVPALRVAIERADEAAADARIIAFPRRE